MFLNSKLIRIEQLKEQAREATLARDWDRQGLIMSELEKLWDDNEAAKAFYTELEALHSKEAATNELIDSLLDAYGDNPVMTGLIRSLAVYVLDPQHAFDRTAAAQALDALGRAAKYAGR
jgi:hypothetical protein